MKQINRPNYIGKHAIQAQKLKQSSMKMKIKSPQSINCYNRMTAYPVTFNQALTAQIIETLGSEGSGYDKGIHFDNSYTYCETNPAMEQFKTIEYKPQSNLDALSLVCHAVLLDHNYNATLPADIPMQHSNAVVPQSNGNNSMYSPGSSKRPRQSIASNTVTNNMLVSSAVSHDDDDAASDISCTSDRKLDTEGEETDTAPEAEAVSKDEQFDRYGDYVTRCICGFLHDDGYMIECDQCKVWQHVRCVVRTKKVPDDYLCEVCDPSKPTDRQKARASQQQWMREIQERDARLRKEQLKQVLSDSDSSDGDQPLNNNVVNKNRRKNDLRQQRPRREPVKDKRPLKRKVSKRKVKLPNKSTSDDEKQQLPQLRQWIDNYEEAVTNHYSPELRARVSSIRINRAHSDIVGQVDPQVQKCKVHYNVGGIKSLVGTTNLAPNTPIIELRGKYMLSTQHRTPNHVSSLTTRQQRPGPFLFFYRLQKDNTEVCVDTRTYGNIARFIRRSCLPNAELKHCIEKGVLHLYIVTTDSVDKNVELTIKHESHDLAAATAPAEVACACGNPDLCQLNKIRKNGDTVTETNNHRKRRGRRLNSVNSENTGSKLKNEIEEEKESKEETVKKESKEEEEDVKTKFATENKDEVVESKPAKADAKVKHNEEKEDVAPVAANLSQVTTRRSSHKSESEERKEHQSLEEKDKSKKLNREERKLQAIVKAFERMEKQEQRKQEHQVKQAHRRESEPTPHKDEDKDSKKGKRKKRKGRTRTLSTNSQSERRSRLNSADSTQAISSDEIMLSPNDQSTVHNPINNCNLLLTLSNGDTTRAEDKSPERVRDVDCNSNSSPETPLSSAYLLVAAAVEPLEPGFKFPKTKKGLMNEWLNKGTDLVQSASSISPSSLTAHIAQTESLYDTSTGFFTPSKNLVSIAQAATYCDPTQSHGSAKKRWLRQAISEDRCDSPCSRAESPPATEMVAPPKKRRLPRESMSSDTSPVDVPQSILGLQKNENDDSTMDMSVVQEIDVSGQVMESENTLSETIDAKLNYSCVHIPENVEPLTRKDKIGCVLDPRLGRDRQPLIANSDHLVGTVERTLSFLGYDDKKPEIITPAKRKVRSTFPSINSGL